MISGIGAVRIKPATGDSGAADFSSSGAASAATAGTPASFAEALSQATTRTVNTLQSAETLSIQALTGGADTRQVVDAVMDAQQALQTTIAIRDKIVTAWLDISRMQI